ncbi:MAG TPA: TetR/AcrR family transcriptional regulator [Anaerolineales bacterium]|nr:TetR/AcrR family transcriptional regulator [Anaerolineales bacterium]
MEQHKEDRRTRRTRQLLRDALLGLLKEKRYDDISVQDIIERADVARSTFYIHYLDKDDLLVGKGGVFASNLGHHVEWRVHEEKNSESIFPTRAWFQHIQAQDPILKIIAKDSAMDLAMKTLHGILRNDIQAKVQGYLQNNKDDSIPSSMVIDYLASSLMTLIKWWVKHDMPYSPQQMDEMFQSLVMPGVLSIRGD